MVVLHEHLQSALVLIVLHCGRPAELPGSQGDSCVEVTRQPVAIHGRDSKAKDRPRFATTSST
ncbi:DUF397 domain-containing protein [Streptomyces avermitilis]|uniref:DUF397 domain-containing protein n=1 Tax=Streptomyces avermitilis TaxID=33903 RepID=UPI003828032C